MRLCGGLARGLERGRDEAAWRCSLWWGRHGAPVADAFSRRFSRLAAWLGGVRDAFAERFAPLGTRMDGWRAEQAEAAERRRALASERFSAFSARRIEPALSDAESRLNRTIAPLGARVRLRLPDVGGALDRRTLVAAAGAAAMFFASLGVWWLQRPAPPPGPTDAEIELIRGFVTGRILTVPNADGSLRRVMSWERAVGVQPK